jgi:SMODS and SLOG-associating 2TM effector domain 1
MSTFMTEDEYAKERLENQIAWYDEKSAWYKRFTLTLQIIEVVSASAIPFLAMLAKLYPFGVSLTSSALGAVVPRGETNS